MQTPFDLIRCSWPRPVEQRAGRWISEPEWEAPLMPRPPQPQWRRLAGELCWSLDWCEAFRQGLTLWKASVSGELPGFHVVFELRANASGTLVFWADDGCIIRRSGRIVHSDPAAHPLARSELAVRAGDHLEVAHWQYADDWTWGARLTETPDPFTAALELLQPYLDRIQTRLGRPAGPALKLFCSGQDSVRAVLSIYSVLLNGYAPAAVYLYGEHQWPGPSRRLFHALLPFARFVPTGEVLDRMEALGQPRLAEWALRHWFVMKSCANLLCPPHEFCGMDEDVFILGPVDEALDRFRQADLVFTPDIDHGGEYLAIWGEICGAREPLRTGTLNAGLYWLRDAGDPQELAAVAARVDPEGLVPYLWEQGLMACRYAQRETYRLSPQRYLFPVFDGLPGGVLNYDYARNPCGFTSIHFAGVAQKPTDAMALTIAQDLLGHSG